MSEVFVARQPIFDRNLHVAGYELLFRGGDAATALVADSEGATASVVLNSFTEIGLERLVGAKPAWVNVSREFVLGGLASTMPPAVVGLEILEDELLDERFVHALIELKRQGYRLALDDFEYSVSAERLLSLVDVVKLDLIALGRERMAREVAEAPDLANAQELIAARDHVMLDDVDVFAGHLAVTERVAGSLQLRVFDLSSGDDHTIAFDEPAYSVHTGGNAEFETATLRFTYTSLTTPASVLRLRPGDARARAA